MKRGRSLRPDEIEVWRAVAESITQRLPSASLPARPEAPKRGALGPAAPPPVPPTAAGWTPPVQARPAGGPGDVERTLRRRVTAGRQAIEASLDLHGYRQGEAHARLQSFITGAHRDGLRFVVIVTGKGRSGDEGERGVLRRLVPLWLAEPRLAPFVVGFGTAARGHGGEGALYVHLRSRTRMRD